MLKNEEVEIEPIPAATTRVTPEELAAAMTRIEARKEAHQRHQAGTVAIGEVVQQLGLDATPEEVLAEVQAERARQKPPPKKRLSARQRLGLWLATGTTVVGLGLASLWFTPSHDVSPSANGSIASSVSATSNQPQHLQLDPNLLVGEASGKIVMLSEVGDNQPVHCLLFNNNGQTLFTTYSPGYSSEDELWTLIKHHGQVYVRGWTYKMSNKVLLENGTDVSSHEGNAFVVPITLPLNNFLVDPGIGSTIEFCAEDIHPDKHAWEKW